MPYTIFRGSGRNSDLCYGSGVKTKPLIKIKGIVAIAFPLDGASRLAILGRLVRSLGQALASAKPESDWIHFVTPRHRRETNNLFSH